MGKISQLLLRRALCITPQPGCLSASQEPVDEAWKIEGTGESHA